MVSDWDAKLNDLPLPLFVVATCLFLYRPAASAQVPRRLLLQIVVGMLALALYGGAIRERMYYVGPGTFYEMPADRVIAKGYFAGLHTGSHLAAVLADMARVKAQRPDARLFFGPRLEFGYAQTGTPSPPGLPLWWHPGTSYGPGDEAAILKAFGQDHVDTLIFLKGDRTRIPAALLAVIARDYRLRAGDGVLDVYDRR